MDSKLFNKILELVKSGYPVQTALRKLDIWSTNAYSEHYNKAGELINGDIIFTDKQKEILKTEKSNYVQNKKINKNDKNCK